MRKNCEGVLNQQGRSILELCQVFNLKILNGRSKRDSLGNFTYNNANLGASTIEYSICSQNLYEYINNFMVLPQNELSDHCKIVTELKGSTNTETLLQDDYYWETLQNNFIWDDSLKALFTQNLENDLYKISDIKQRIEAGLIGSTGKKIQDLFVQTAIKVVNPKQEKNKAHQSVKRKQGTPIS